MILPEGAFIVLADKAQETTASGLILTADVQEEPDTGVVCFVSPDLEEHISKKVRFRKNFGEELEIEGIKYLYFRDFNSSIYYILN